MDISIKVDGEVYIPVKDKDNWGCSDCELINYCGKKIVKSRGKEVICKSFGENMHFVKKHKL